MLGHYLAAVRVGKRNIQRAYDEDRVKRGAMMVVWFCRQVEYSWTLPRWAQAQAMMCRGRTQAERRQLGALTGGVTASHSPLNSRGMGRVPPPSTYLESTRTSVL